MYVYFFILELTRPQQKKAGRKCDLDRWKCSTFQVIETNFQLIDITDD